MNSIDLVVNFFKQGGAFLYPIAAVFAVGIAVAIERFIYLTLVARGNRRLWSQLAPQIQSGNYRKAMEIADLVKARGIALDRRRIVLDTPLKTLGTHKVPIRLHPEVVAEVEVAVTKEA